MWLVSCRRQGMLTKGPTPDPKCKVNISSFLTFPHLLDFHIYCLIYTRNSVPIVLLLWRMAGWHRFEVLDSYQGVGVRREAGYYLIVCFFLLVLLPFDLSCPVSFFKWVEHDSCCVYFFVYYLLSLSPVHLTTGYWRVEIVLSLM